MRHARIFFIIGCMALTVGVIAGCNRGSSQTFIAPDDMEKILYDYHLADAMAQQADGGYDKNVLEYRAAVLKKYGVSQEKFDTSMVYYMRHTDQLHTMYEHIAERMQDEAQRIGADASGGQATAMGDSANVWKGANTLLLMPCEPYNVHSYNLTTDTTFHKGDRLLLNFRTDFIFQDGMRDGVAMLAVVLGNDSVVARTIHLSSSMPMTLQVDDADSLGVKAIKGFFFLAKNNDTSASATTLQLMSVSDIQLLRVHSKSKPQKPVQGTMPVGATPDSGRMRIQNVR